MSPLAPWIVSSAKRTETVRHNVRRWAVARGHDLERFHDSATPGVKAALCRNPGCAAIAFVDHNAYRSWGADEQCPARIHPGRP